MSEIPLFVRLRGAVFHERGFSFNVPASLKSAAYFIEQRDGKAQSMTPVPGACESSGDGMVFVHLTPYRDEIEAKKLVVQLCRLLPDVLDGERAAKTAFGLIFWRLLEQCKKDGDAANALRRLKCLLGELRVAVYAKSREQVEIDVERFVEEALGIRDT